MLIGTIVFGLMAGGAAIHDKRISQTNRISVGIRTAFMVKV
jgi:hypothetical protein